MHKPIYYLTRTYAGVTPENLLKGVLKAAREEKRTLFALYGKKLGDDWSHIYDYINPNDAAGIITWASTTSDSNNPLYQKFKNHPRVSLSTVQPGMKSIIADSYSGMKEVLEHLIKKHNRTKILIIRGPIDNDYAQERYKAYQDVLNAEGLGINDKLISDIGRWELERGVDCVSDFIDNRRLVPGKDFDALVAVNDKLALGALTEFKRRKIRVPETVSVIGFNGSQEAVSFSPSVTTGAMPFINQGYQGVKSIIEMESGNFQSTIMKLPTTILYGQSCGCLSERVNNAIAGNVINTNFNIKKRFNKKNEPVISNTNIQFEANKETTIRVIVEEVLPIISNNIITPKLKNYCLDVCNALVEDFKTSEKGHFIIILSRFLNYLRENRFNLEGVHDLLSLFRVHIGALIENYDNYLFAEDIISQGRVLVSEICLKQREKETQDAYDETVKLQKLSSKLMTAFSMDAVCNVLSKDLPTLKIDGVYICIYNDNDSDFYTAYGHYNKKGQQKIPAETLFPPDFTNSCNGVVFAIHSLMLERQKIGHIIYEINSENGILYTTLTDQISSTISSIQMRNENERVKNTIQEILSLVENKVEVVSENSNSINTGVHEGSTAMEEIAANIKEISRNLQDVTNKIETSVQQINDTNSEVGRLIEESDKIESIVAIITDIAERTKLLSFNASIEAARAGNAGKGFSIVSKEVKNLAYSTITSAENIKVNIDNVQNVTQKTSEAVLTLKNMINKIADSSVIIDHAINEQSLATTELSSLFINAANGTEQIAYALKEIKDIIKISE